MGIAGIVIAGGIAAAVYSATKKKDDSEDDDGAGEDTTTTVDSNASSDVRVGGDGNTRKEGLPHISNRRSKLLEIRKQIVDARASLDELIV